MKKKVVLAALFFVCGFSLTVVACGKQRETAVDSVKEESVEEDGEGDMDDFMSAEIPFENESSTKETSLTNSSHKEEVNASSSLMPSDGDISKKQDSFQENDANKKNTDRKESEDIVKSDPTEVSADHKEEIVVQETVQEDKKGDVDQDQPKEEVPDEAVKEEISYEKLTGASEEYYVEEIHVKTGAHEGRVILSNGNVCFGVGESHCVLTSAQSDIVDERLEENRVEMNQLKYVAKMPSMPGVFLVVTDTFPLEVPEEEFYENPEYAEYLVFESEAEAREYKAKSRKEVYENTILALMNE